MMKKNPWLLFAALFIASPWSFQLDEAQETTHTKSFAVSKGGMLEVSIDGGDIRVSAWEKNEVFVKAYGIDERDADRLKMTQTDNTVRVTYRSRGGWFSHERNVLFEIQVPAQFDVDLQTSGGDIQIQGSLMGKLRGSTSGGDIRLGNVGGKVDMHTSGGDIRTGKIQGDAILKTSGGDIIVATVSGDAEVTTSGGDIRVESTGKTLKARTSGGDITVGDVGGEATVSTSGGDVSVGKVSGKASLSTAGGNVKLGGASGVVTAKTAGGDIRLDNISGSVEAKTAGGEVQAELIPSGKGKSRLLSSGGDVVLYLPENAKATIDARIRIHGWWGFGNPEYSIHSDFKPETYEKDKDAEEIRATYVLNGGGETITLETANSNIMIRKLRK